ncbi:nucleoside monophosphate kinase [Candidatus Saccharibacteria bacterium]|nr:nucleoside monophosphate kinase [Candidatus Saccharibacteria bacterium]
MPSFKSFDIFLGGPGSGKDTQAQLLVSRHGFELMPIGELLRTYAKTNTKVEQQLDSGMLVDDAIVNEAVMLQLQQYNSTDRIIADGFPRNVSQAKWLSEVLIANNQTISHVFWLKIDRDEAQRRLAKRGRDDDLSHLVDRRFSVYETQTLPVVEYFRQKEFVVEVDGQQSVEDVYKVIEREINR